MPNQQKIESLKKQARLLWPKYDPDLDTMVNGRKKIHEYVDHIFAGCNLQADLVQLKQQRNLDDIIDMQAQKAAKNDKTQWNAKDVSLNQAQIHALIEELYGEKLDSIIKSNIGAGDKKLKGPGNSSINTLTGSGDYADYYKRIREMAKDKGMKEDDVLRLLKER